MFIIAALAITLIVIFASIWIYLTGILSNSQLNISNINATVYTYLITVNNENISLSKLISIKGIKVRDLRPVEGVFIYNTSVTQTSEGPMYEVWIYNISKINSTAWIITRLVKTYLGNNVISYREVYIVRNNTVYLLKTETNNATYYWNIVVSPAVPDSISILVAPPLWLYVRDKAKWKVTVITNATYKYLRNPWSYSSKIIEEATVTGITDCNGPSGKCYIIKSRVASLMHPKHRPISQEYNYILYIDAKTGIITYVKRCGRKFTSEIKLVKWVVKD